MEKRLGSVTIFIYDKSNAAKVNEILSEYSGIIISRMGVPYKEKDTAIIVLIIDGTNDEIGALTGKIGNIKGVSAKSVVAKK